jgi:hypothetical protein
VLTLDLAWETLQKRIHDRKYGGVVIDLSGETPSVMNSLKMPPGMVLIVNPDKTTQTLPSQSLTRDLFGMLFKPEGKPAHEA